MTVRVGFVGAGLIARFHADSLRRGGADAEIVATHDIDQPRAQAFASDFGGQVVSSVPEVLTAVDAVYVCTWTSEHRHIVEQAASTGVAVFCEKPLATSLADAVAMTEAVQAAGVINQVGLVLRSSPAFSRFRDEIRSADSGRVMSFTFRDDQEIPIGGFYASDWRGDVDRAGAGTLIEHSIHDIDILEWLLGPVRRVTASQAGFHEIEGIEDSVAVMLELEGGGVGVLTSVWHDIPSRASARRFEVFCERARVELEGNIDGTVSWFRTDDDHGSVDGRSLGTDGRANADVDFIAAVASGEPASPDFAVALRAHVIVDAIYRSAQSGGAPIDIE